MGFRDGFRELECGPEVLGFFCGESPFFYAAEKPEKYPKPQKNRTAGGRVMAQTELKAARFVFFVSKKSKKWTGHLVVDSVGGPSIDYVAPFRSNPRRGLFHSCCATWISSGENV
jgi:hypothetical protein